MLSLFCPDYYIQSFATLDLHKLQERGIKLLICDIDNTLVAHDIAVANNDVIDFIERVKEIGIKVILISNNVEERVKTFADPMHVPYYSFAMKPLKITYQKCLKDNPYKREEIAVLGDQLLTDIFGAKRMKFYTILSSPVVLRDMKFTKINRIFENIIYYLLAKKKWLVRGEFDE
ncbi:MAG: YqeG family HAD IIIA-type phosphatase [Erysipelotrichaceae bacterium]